MTFLFYALIFLTSADVIMSPKHCLPEKKFPCLVSSKKKSSIEIGNTTLYFSANHFSIFNTIDDVFLARGSLWLQTKKKLIIQTRFGDIINNSGDADFLIHSDPDSTYSISVTRGHIQVIPKGADSTVLSPGYSARMSSADYESKSCRISQKISIDMQTYIRQLNTVFPFGDSSLEDHLQTAAGAILWASEQHSKFLETHTTRQLASSEQRKHHTLIKKREASQYELYLKRLFRIKSNFEDL